MSPLTLRLLLLVALSSGCDSGDVSGDGPIYPGGRYFGRSVALDGDVALVGADDSDEAFVVAKAGGVWRVEGRLQPEGYPDRGSGGAENNVLYGWDVGLDGDVAVVGAPIFASGREAQSARAFIYERRGGSWGEAAELRPPPAPAGAELQFFGLPVDVSDGRVAVASRGSSAQDGGVADPAAVLVYERTASGWTETGRVEDPDFEPASALGNGSGFGGGMALDGDRLAVGSAGQDLGAVRDAGVVRVYARTGAVWSPSATLSPPAPQPNDRLGSAIALSGPLLAAASLDMRVEGETGSGSVSVFREFEGGWAFEANLRPDSLGALDSYGFAVAADSGPLGDRVAVSAAGRARSRGAVFVWVRRPSGAWGLEAELVPAGLGQGSAFGEDVAIDGDRLLAGAIFDQGGRGGVYEFRLGPDGWVQVLD